MKILVFYLLSLCFLLKEFKCQLNRNPGRIIGGEDAELSLAPFIVSIQLTYKNSGHNCGGSLVTFRHVLTAAHCFSNMDEAVVRMYIKVVHDVLSTLSKGTSIRQTRDVANLIVHRKYNGSDYDIAILKLKKPFNKDGITQTINLAKEDFSNGQKCVIFGWGRFSNSIKEPAKKLQMAAVSISSLLVCPQITPSTEICAGTMFGPDACMGDSGGPLVCNDKLAGIVSRGVSPCATPLIGTIYTKVSHYQNWIKSNTHGRDRNQQRRANSKNNQKSRNKIGTNSLVLLTFYFYIGI